MSTAVGIDLGTTNSVVAISQGGRPRVLPGPDGNPLIPSVVSFHPNGQTVVGAAARLRRPIDPTNTVFSVKRLMGRPFESEEVKRARSRFPFEMREGPDAAILLKTRSGDLSLPEISALILREIRRIAETSLGEKIDRAVVTVPANFNELQRTATKIAGQIADLDIIRILNEPTAAALAYGYGRGTREKIAVYDFGGGTFDVTLLELSGNVFEVLATAGDTFLGGDDIDLLITENLADALVSAHRIDARQDRRAYELLRAAAEQAKIDLSAGENATIRVPEIGYAAGGRPLEFRARMTRMELEKLAAPLIGRTFDVCHEAMKLAGLTGHDFQTVILVGGSSRIPAVRNGVRDFFSREPLSTLPPEQVVGMGAAILAEALTAVRKAVASVHPPAATTKTKSVPPTASPGVASGAGTGRVLQSASRAIPQARPPSIPPGPTQPRPMRAPTGGFPGPGGPIAGADANVFRKRTTTNPGVAPAPPGLNETPGSALRARTNPGLGTSTSDFGVPTFDPQRRIDTLDEPEFEQTGRIVPVGSPTGSTNESRRAANPAGYSTQPGLAPQRSSPNYGGPGTNPPSPAFARTYVSDTEPTSPNALTGVDPNTVSAPDFESTMIDPGSLPQPPSQPPPPVRGTGPIGNRTQVVKAAVPPPAPPSAFAKTSNIAAQPPPGPPQQNAWAQTYVAPPNAPAQSVAMGPRLTESSLGFKAVRPEQAAATQIANPQPAVSPGRLSGVEQAVAVPVMQHAFGAVPNASMPTERALPLLLDVTPHSLGIETVGGMCEAVIPRNATIPVEQSREFATAVHGQDAVRIRISQGESRRFGENQPLGELVLSEITRAPRGEVKIVVTFELDADGTLSVRAREPATGRETRTRVTLLTMPSAAETANMAQRQRNRA